MDYKSRLPERTRTIGEKLSDPITYLRLGFITAGAIGGGLADYTYLRSPYWGVGIIAGGLAVDAIDSYIIKPIMRRTRKRV